MRIALCATAQRVFFYFMPASNTDKFTKAARKFTTNLDSSGISDSSVDNFGLNSSGGLATDVAVVITVDRVDQNGVKTPDKEEGILGVVSGTDIIDAIRGFEGTAQSHAAGAVVEVRLLAGQWNRLIDGLLLEHNQDGTHDAAALAVALASYFVGPGTGFAANVALNENALVLDPSLSADGKYSGIVEAGTAGAALTFGKLCYLNNEDSRWELVDANLSDGYDKKLGICVLAAAADADPTLMLLFGKVRADSEFPTLTAGAAVYMSETAGAITATAPTTTDAAVRVIGHGNAGDELFFHPSPDYIIHI